MSLSTLEIAQVLEEIAPRLQGERIRRIYQRDPLTLLLALRQTTLCISVHPQASRLHLQPVPAPRISAGPFVQLLRRRLQGRRITAIRQQAGDRMVRLEAGEMDGQPVCLLAELTGLHGNVFWLEGNVVVASLRADRSQRRHNRPGQPYTPLLGRADPSAARSRFASAASPSDAVRAHYEARLTEIREQALRAQLSRPLRRRIGQQRRLVARLEQDLARHQARTIETRWGELLLAQLSLVPARATAVRLRDLFQPDSEVEVEIPLDPRLSPAQNATRYLARGARAQRGIAQVSRRLTETREAIARAETDLARLERLPVQALEQLAAQHGTQRPEPAQSGRARRGKAKRAAPARRAQIRTFSARSGQRILVGRDAASNDELTFRRARGRDIWLHARDVPGAHVVLWMQRPGPPDPEALRDAALLAKHYSSARREPACRVQWAYVKHLRRGKAPGAVYVSDEHTLEVPRDAARLTRLFRDHTEPVQPLRDALAKLPAAPVQEADPPPRGGPDRNVFGPSRRRRRDTEEGDSPP